MAKVATRSISASHEDDCMPDLKDDGAVSFPGDIRCVV